MAKNQLLPFLRLIILHFVLLIPLNAVGSSIAKSEVLESKVLENGMPEQSYAIRVFVSSSMQVSLLKSYAYDAKKYGATLVFKGLPGNSFKELSKLVLAMRDGGPEEDNDMSSIQIDDEAFDRFKVTQVPSIILSDESRCEAPDVCKPAYDKIDGNIESRSP